MAIGWVRMLVSLALVAAVIVICTRTGDAHHAVLRFNLEEMTATADRIFVGRCLAVEETDEVIAQGRMPVTRYTFLLGPPNDSGAQVIHKVPAVGWVLGLGLGARIL